MKAGFVSVLLVALVACADDDQFTETDGPQLWPSFSRCDPLDDNPCPGPAIEQMCCSDDPAAINFSDLGALALPKYQGRAGEGTPLFSGNNSVLGRSGACVDSGSVPSSAALREENARGCPIPCNPTWADADIATVCGGGEQCCQIQEIELDDCIFDPGLGEDGCWRPVVGSDIDGLGETNATNWGIAEHATHQDPDGVSCQVFVSAIPSSVFSSYGISEQDLLSACLRRLTVADQRGWCSNSLGVQTCPYAESTYVDACGELNHQQQLGAC